MQISNEIVLRPRFSQPLDINQNKVLELFENAKNSQDAIKINILDSHVFLKIPIAQQHFWSPLELVELNNGLMKGLKWKYKDCFLFCEVIWF